eukprot:340784-Amphidinium_carterae.3
MRSTDFVLAAPPRLVHAGLNSTLFWVFTDAAVENNRDGEVTVGGVMHTPSNVAPHAFFAAALPAEVVKEWFEDAPIQPFCHAKTFAVLIAKAPWAPMT